MLMTQQTNKDFPSEGLISGLHQQMSTRTDMRNKILAPPNGTYATRFNEDKIPPSDMKSIKYLSFKDQKTAQLQTVMSH